MNKQSSKTINFSTEIQLTHQQLMKDVAKNAPSKKALFQRVLGGGTSRREAIKAKCIECCCLNAAEVRNCAAYRCPLWHLRPFQK